MEKLGESSAAASECFGRDETPDILAASIADDVAASCDAVSNMDLVVRAGEVWVRLGQAHSRTCGLSPPRNATKRLETSILPV
jgi:hypothetical protein